MTRRRHAQAIPASAVAVAHLAAEAQFITGRPMPPAEMCELLTQARQMQFHQFLKRSGVPLMGPAAHRPLPIGRVSYSPAAYAALRGIKGPAADMFTEIAGIIQNARETTPW